MFWVRFFLYAVPKQNTSTFKPFRINIELSSLRRRGLEPGSQGGISAAVYT